VLNKLSEGFIVIVVEHVLIGVNDIVVVIVVVVGRSVVGVDVDVDISLE